MCVLLPGQTPQEPVEGNYYRSVSVIEVLSKTAKSVSFLGPNVLTPLKKEKYILSLSNNMLA